MYLLYHDTMYFKIEILTSRKLTTSLSFEQLGPGILQEARVTQMVISDENMKINLNDCGNFPWKYVQYIFHQDRKQPNTNTRNM